MFLSYVFYVFERRLSVLILAKRSKTWFVCCLWLFIVVENKICGFCFMQITGLFVVRFRVCVQVGFVDNDGILTLFGIFVDLLCDDTGTIWRFDVV